MASISSITLPDNTTYTLKDGSGDFVEKSGDTMTGNLYRKNNSMDTSATSIPSQLYSIIGFQDKNDRTIGYVQASEATNGSSLMDIGTRRYNSSTNQTNYLRLVMDKESNAAVQFSHPEAWREGLNVVNKAGDTMTGALTVPTVTLQADSNNIAWLKANTTNRNSTVLKIYGSDRTDGDAVLLSAGGLTIVGGGESAQSLYNEYVVNGTTTPGTEATMIGADTNIYITPNCQTIADKLEWVFDTNRTLRFPDGGQLSTWANGTVEIVSNPDTSTSKTNYKMALALKGENNYPLFRIYDGSSWGSYVGLLPMTGGTITGNITRKNTVMDNTATTLSAAQYSGYYATDKNDEIIGLLQTVQGTSGNTYTQVLSRHTDSSNANVDHYLRVGVDASGNRTLAVSDAALWRKTLGLGNTSTGALPVLVSQGGTGRTTLTADYFLGGNGTSAVQMWDADSAWEKLGRYRTKILYGNANSSGSNGTITLNDTVISSTMYMRVHFKDNNGKVVGSINVYDHDPGTVFCAFAVEAASRNSTVIRRTLYTIDSTGTKLTPSNGGYVQFSTTATSGESNTMTVTGTGNNTNYLRIYLVERIDVEF